MHLFLICCIRWGATQTEKNRNRDETTHRAPPGTIAVMFRTFCKQSSRPALCVHRKGPRIVSNTRTVSLRLSSFSLNIIGVQFNPSMSRTRKATHRTQVAAAFDVASSRLF
ncbi:MAG: hypothetical protein K2X78_13085 [Burkholderiaceae bacterium]|nr:hypothetical protein [Burkholderiaceae bacterium]